MNIKDLNRANKLHEEIRELESFIFAAERVWTGKINLKNIISNGFGAFNQREFNMNTQIKNKVLDVLIEYLRDLKIELDEL